MPSDTGVELICVGDVMLDVSASSGELAPGGDVHGRVVLRPGGTSANAAVWAASRGARAAVVGAVGDDIAGDLAIRALDRHGVSTSGIARKRAPTGVMLIVQEAGERSMVADRGANAMLEPGDLPALEAECVLISGYLLLQDPTTPTAEAAMEMARARWLAVEAASWPLVEAFGPDRFFGLTQLCGVLLSNEDEARALTGREGEDAARALGERYRLAVVKRGDAGAVMCVEGRIVGCDAAPVREVDPTGCGDAFDGVLLARLGRGDEPEQALEDACRAGGLVAATRGTWPPLEDGE